MVSGSQMWKFAALLCLINLISLGFGLLVWQNRIFDDQVNLDSKNLGIFENNWQINR